MKIDVSIIIVNYNTRQMTSECIESVFDKTRDLVFEIILIDNGSKDGSKEFFEKDKRIKYIYLNSNLGFGQANNEGIKIAEGRNILFLNPDTILLNNAIKILSEYLDSHEKVGACGGNLYNDKLEPNYSYTHLLPSIFSEFDQILGYRLSKIKYHGNQIFNFTTRPIQVKHITGADLMVKKSVISKIGGFSNQIFMYFEDTELNYRIGKSNYDIVNYPLAKIIHLEGKSCSVSEKRERNYLTGRNSYYRLVYSIPYKKVADFLFACYIRGAIFYSFLIQNKANICKYRSRLEIFNEINNINRDF